MQVITASQIREKARELQQEGRNWHFHILYPGCVFNTQSHQYALVLEDRSSDQTFVTYSDKSFLKINRELLNIYYGDSYLENPISEYNQVNHASKLLDQVDVFRQNHIPWHHHMLFPDCIFNQYPGKWNIVLEGDRPNLIFNELFDDEPLEVLRQLEIRYLERN